MPKIMLVEDDSNLREIYGERLIAEGYEIVSAGDGEEALALAVREKPDLIIADVMMPKISGFDMLDILRQAPETKDTKVIIMTALSQAEDKNRASALGADKYLVKSQVTLEDVARVVHDLLYGADSRPNSTPPSAANPPAVTTPSDELSHSPSLVVNNENNNPQGGKDKKMDMPEPTISPVPTTDSAPPAISTNPVPSQAPIADTSAPAVNTNGAESTTQETAEVDGQIRQFMASEPAEQPQHVAPLMEPSPPSSAITPSPTVPTVPTFGSIPNVVGDKVIQPIGDDSTAKPKDINQLYAEEMAKETPETSPVADDQTPAPSTPPVPLATEDDAQPSDNPVTDQPPFGSPGQDSL
jgi:CheY-like chemotaxis protein